MAKSIAISMTENQAKATAQAIQNSYKAIEERLEQVDKSMLSVAPLMATLKDTGGWKFLDDLTADGETTHKTFTKFAEDYFGKSHSVISETVKVGSRFFKNGTLVNEDYAGYSYTQLLRLSPLTDAEIKEHEFNPDMTSTDIRKKVSDIVKAKRLEEKPADNEENSQNALNEALAKLGVEVEPEPEPEPEPENDAEPHMVYSREELPEAVKEWFDSLPFFEVTIVTTKE